MFYKNKKTKFLLSFVVYCGKIFFWGNSECGGRRHRLKERWERELSNKLITNDS